MRKLVRADVTRIIRFEPDGSGTLLAGTNADDRPGSLGPIEPGLATAEVLRTGRTVRVDDFGGISSDLVARWFGAAGSPRRRSGARWSSPAPFGAQSWPAPWKDRSLRRPNSVWLSSLSCSRSRSPTPPAGPSWRPPGRASSSPATRPGAGSSETCTTESSSASSPSRCDCAGPNDGCLRRSKRSKRCSQRPCRN